jgi:hypothetical protein
MLQNQLLSEISSGGISAEDKDALSAALDSIDATLKGERPSIGSKPPSPGEMQSKVESLISDQVENGSLTSEQAEELKTIFANAMPRGGPGGPGGAPGAGGIGGTSESDESDSSDELADVLSDFIKMLQEAKGSKSYGESGDQLLSSISALIVDYQA